MRNAIAVALALLALTAWASDKVVASLTIGTGAAVSTASPTTGSATWLQGGMVWLQCDQDVYATWDTPAGSSTPTVATSAAQRINFTSNNDPYPIYLGNNEKHISVLAVSAAGTCKFIVSPHRRKPQ